MEICVCESTSYTSRSPRWACPCLLAKKRLKASSSCHKSFQISRITFAKPINHLLFAFKRSNLIQTHWIDKVGTQRCRSSTLFSRRELGRQIRSLNQRSGPIITNWWRWMGPPAKKEAQMTMRHWAMFRTSFHLQTASIFQNMHKRIKVVVWRAKWAMISLTTIRPLEICRALPSRREMQIMEVHQQR